MLKLYGGRFFIFKLLYIQQALCLPLENNSRIIYDQRQTGKYNIHISLKDVAIIEVDKNEFSDATSNNEEEYYYDEDDLTIRPISTWIISTPTTVKPPPMINTSTTNVVVPHSSLDTDLHSSLSPIPSHNSVVPDFDQPVFNNQQAMEGNTSHQRHVQRSRMPMNSVKEIISDKFRREKELPPEQIVNCRTNYVIDSTGNCRKKRRSSFLKSLFDVLKLMQYKEV